MTTKISKKGATKPAVAVHVKKKNAQAVFFDGIRVMILNDDGHWFARALEMDYWAQGESLEGVQDNFTKGLACTIQEHLKMFGGITKLLRVAPQSEWDIYYQNKQNFGYTHVSFYIKESARKKAREQQIPLELLFMYPKTKLPGAVRPGLIPVK